MTGPAGNSELKKIKGKQNSLFPGGPVIECFVMPPTQN